MYLLYCHLPPLMPGSAFMQYNLPVIVIFRLRCQTISDSIITIVQQFLTGANRGVGPGQNNGGRGQNHRLQTHRGKKWNEPLLH